MIVVADAGPLHYLVLIGEAEVLQPLYGRVLVRSWIVQPPHWCEIRPDPPLDPNLRFLDAGERAAIALALIAKADRLLIDQQAGRAEAERRHLPVTGTLGVLAEAHRAGFCDFEAALACLMSDELLYFG